MKDVTRRAISSLRRKHHKREYAATKGVVIPWPDNTQAFLLAKQLTKDGIKPCDSGEIIQEFYNEAIKLDLMYDSEDEDIIFDIFEAYMSDSWAKIKPGLDLALDMAIDRAKKNGTPPEAEAIKDKDTRFLASVCRELQAIHGEKPFYLSQTDAGKVIGKGRPAGAGRLLLLTKNSIIKLHKLGHTGYASEFFFLGTFVPR